jgi:organic radical activating enzyme
MFIDKIESGFTNKITIGKYAIFIYTKKDSAFISPDELFDKIQSFNYIVFTGDDPLLQKEELGKICRKLTKQNPNVRIEINTFGTIRPLEISYYRDNVVFNVNVLLSNSGIKWPDRVNELTMPFYIEIGANFIFDIKTLDNIDEVISLVTALGIKKSQVFLSSIDIDINKYAKLNGFNIAPIIEW